MKIKILNKKIEIFLRYTTFLFLVLLLTSEFFSKALISVFTSVSYFILKFFVPVEVVGSVLLVAQSQVYSIISACIAPSAYILIAMVFFSLPLDYFKSVKLFIYGFLTFTVLNLLRIIIFMFINLHIGKEVFEILHILFYEVFSGIFVAVLIIYFLRKSKIKSQYPFVSDIIYLKNQFK